MNLKKITFVLMLATTISLGSCNKTSSDSSGSTTTSEITENYLSVSDALALIPEETGYEASERVLVKGVIDNVSNPTYGEMTISDETSSLYVYGTYDASGAIRYGELTEKPTKGDTIYLNALLSNFKGTKQIKSGWINKFDKKEITESDYQSKTISQARDAAKGDLVRINGTVASITYANGKVPDGVILVDETSSIYVYDGVIASSVKIGNTIDVLGEKDYFIAANEADNASKYNYKGSCQLTNARLMSNDNQISEYNNEWIESTTIKEIMEKDPSENITSKIYKVNALVKKSEETGFTNYYFDDLDEKTGSYTYTKCNGSDFTWLDKFDGKICTTYLTAINAKSSATGCIWRFLPITVIDENYKFDLNNATRFVLDYHVLDQFEKVYEANPQKELITTVSSTLLGFEGVNLTYVSSNEEIMKFENVDGKIVFNTLAVGKATVTATATLDGYYTASSTFEIEVREKVEAKGITVKQAIDAPIDTANALTIKGIVGPSVVNKDGFYLIDDSGAIAVVLNNKADFSKISIGNLVSVTGYKDRFKSSSGSYGQLCISKATITANEYGEHTYSTASFIKDKTLSDIINLDVANDEAATMNVYEIEAKITVETTSYSSTIKLVDGNTTGMLYSSGASQYSWLTEYNDGNVYKLEVAPCNWNSKTPFKLCVLSLTDSNGTKIVNSLNFAN